MHGFWPVPDGHQLFRPLITLDCRDAETAASLMAEALTPGRPYILFANLNQLPLVGAACASISTASWRYSDST